MPLPFGQDPLKTKKSSDSFPLKPTGENNIYSCANGRKDSQEQISLFLSAPHHWQADSIWLRPLEKMNHISSSDRFPLKPTGENNKYSYANGRKVTGADISLSLAAAPLASRPPEVGCQEICTSKTVGTLDDPTLHLRSSSREVRIRVPIFFL